MRSWPTKGSAIICLIVFAANVHPQYPLILVANRDEFHARPTAAAAWWENGAWLGGRDLKAGGSWLAVSRSGRVGAVTNFRQPGQQEGSFSRGNIPTGFVSGRADPKEFASNVVVDSRFGGFNALFFDPRLGLALASNRGADRVVAGARNIQAICNGDLGHDWPKMIRACERLSAHLTDRSRPVDTAHLATVLADRRQAPDSNLPDTGVGLELERRLSPMMIVSPEYGTRSTTVVAIGSQEARLYERRFDSNGDEVANAEFSWKLRCPPVTEP